MDFEGINNTQENALYGSFIPNFLRSQFSNERDFREEEASNDSEAVLLWLDICDFSAMCNRLMKEPESGVNKISSLLQKHYDFLLDNIVRLGGTPLFFVGDGLMAFWPTDTFDKTECLQRAITCAFRILDQRHTLNDKNELISIHAVIASGICKMTELDGPHSKKHFSFYGDAFNELRLASKNRASNQVLIRNSVMPFIHNEVVSEPLEYETSILLENPYLDLKFEDIEQAIWNYSEVSLAKIKDFIPTTLNLPLSKERLEWLSEVRPVSVVFIRFENVHEDTEAKVHDMDELSKIITPLVDKHDGLMNMVWMDEKATNVLICFGPAPSAHIDNPLRSIKLAFELNHILMKSGYKASIGIGTDLAYCGVLGNDHLRQYTIIGDVVNLSSRYSAITTHGIVCDEATYKASRNSVIFDSPIKVSIKGESNLVKLYPIKSVDEGVSEYTQSGSSKIIGREKELELLIEGFKKTDEHNSPIVIIEGESGMGKSTLRKEFISKLSDKRLVYTNSATYLERRTPYYIWSEIFRLILQLNTSFDASDQTKKLQEIEERFGEKACLLNIVLQTNLQESEWFRELTAAQKVEESHNFLLEILSEVSSQEKLIIMFNDGAWIDETSWKLIESINSTLGNILLILSFEIDSEHIEIEYSKFKNLVHIQLQHLDEVSLKNLILAKLEVSQVSNEILDLTRRVAKGNPFFSLEFINSLLDENLIITDGESSELSKEAILGEHSLPETVRGALRRRIDKMDAGSQLTLKVGSVVGYKFSKEIVGDIFPISNERHHVGSYMEEAKNSGFLNETVIDNFDGYLFNNSSIADISYESILADQKRFLHDKSAVWYENKFKDNLQPFYVRLANHWHKAGDKRKSLGYFKKESTRLFSLGYIRQALLFGMEGVKILDYHLTLDKEVIGAQIAEYSNDIQILMNNQSISSLLDQKKLDNLDTEDLIEMLLYLGPLAHQSHEPELFALLAIICLKLTLEQGNGNLSAMVYAMYSIIFKAFTGNSAMALEWSNLAIAMDNKNNNSYQSSVSFIHGWFIAHWMRPVRSLIELADQGADAGFKTGDILYACFNLSLSVVLKNAAGVELNQVVASADENVLRNKNQVVNAAFHLKHEKQMAKAFLGKTESYTSLSDDEIDEEKEIATIVSSDMYNQIAYYFISKLKLNTHYGQWKEAIEWGDKAYPLLMAFANQPGQVDLEFYYGLASLYCASEETGEAANAHKKRADEIIDNLANWQEACPDNFLHKYLLLKAVRNALNGDHENANELFQKAAIQAQKEEYYNDAGLVYEHLVRMNSNRKKSFTKEKQQAIESYLKWGAQAKIRYLKEAFPD